jgi:hypothetical protein
MFQAIKRYLLLIVGVVLCSLLCSFALPWWLTARGSTGPTVLQSQSPVVSMLVTVLCFAAATAVALVVGRLINAVVGLFVLGSGVFFLAMQLANVQELAFAGGSMTLLAIETALGGVLVLAASVVMFAVAGPLPDIEPEHTSAECPSPWSPDGLAAAAAALLVLPAVWFVAKSTMKGQVIGAVFAGALLAGLIGRLVRPHVQPVVLFAAPVFVGALGHLAAGIMTKTPLSDAYVDGTLVPLALPMPIDYVAGSLLGVAMGRGWAKSFLHHEEEHVAATTVEG